MTHSMAAPRRRTVVSIARAGLFAGALAMTLPALTGCATSGKLAATNADAVELAVGRVKPALVRIAVVEPFYSDGRQQRESLTGSGTIISPDGYVVTNHHVAGNAAHLIVTLPSLEEVPAVLVGTDPATDIAVIKLTPTEPTVWPVAKFGDSDTVRVGDPVIALGSPWGISQSATLGVMSNTSMVIPRLFSEGFFRLDGENVGELVRWFGHDAEIKGGNSGGPLVNLNGEIIGVNEITYALNGAIPGNLAREVADTLIEKGYVPRAYAGIRFQPLMRGDGRREGALVATVLPGSPAEEAGMMSGDIVLSLGSSPVTARFLEDLPLVNNVVAHLPIGKSVPVRVERNGETVDLTMTATEREPAKADEFEMRDWGMTASNLSVFRRLQMGRESAEGVLVTTRSSGSPLAQAKPEILRGDVIVRVNDTKVRTLDDLWALTNGEKLPIGERQKVLVTFERSGEEFLTVVEIGVDELPDPSPSVVKAWLPMETQVLTRDLAEGVGLAGKKGVRVTRLYNQRPDGFPFEVGDIITHIDGDPLEASQIHDGALFSDTIRAYKRGSEVEFTILRNGESSNVKTTLMDSPPRLDELARYRSLDFDFMVREAGYYDREDPTLHGIDVKVLISAVTGGGWASLAGLQPGDVVLDINGEPVSSVDDVERLMVGIAETRPRSVVFRVRRGTQFAFLEMEPDWDAHN